MRFKKNILKFSILAAVLACAIIAGSMFVFGAETNSSVEKLNLTFVTSDLNEGKFTLTAKVANPEKNVKPNLIAGLEITLNYPDSVKVESVVAANELEKISETAYNTDNGRVKFVCIKDSFDSKTGYETLGELFTVTFSTESTVNPAVLFNGNDIECLVGNVIANLVDANSVYAGDMEALALEILNNGLGLELAADANVGSMIVIANPPAANSSTGGSDTINGEIIQYKTGSTITVGGKEAQLVVKGDLDKDGFVSVFDAVMINKVTESDKLENAAGDLGTTNDVKQAIEYIVGNTTQLTK